MKKLPGILIFLLISSCGQGYLKIAYLGSFTGSDATLGNSARDGAILAVEKINSQGGIKGTKLILDFFDDKSTPGEAQNQGKKILDQKYFLVIGPFSTGRAIEVAPIFNQARTLTLGPTVAGVQLSYSDDYFFRLYPSTMDFGRKLGKEILKREFQRPSVMMDNTNTGFAEPVLSGIQEVLGPGMGVKSLAFKSKENPDYSALGEKILETNPDVIVIIAPSSILSLAAQEIRKFDRKVVLMTPPYGMDQGLFVNGGDAVEGLIGEIPYDLNSQKSTYQDFLKMFTNRFGKSPTHAALANWEAVGVLAEGLREADSWTADKIKRSILNKRVFEGLQDGFEIDLNGDAQRKLNIYRVEKGSFVKED